MDYLIVEFRNKLVETVNGEQLPLEVKRMVLCEVLRAVEEATKNVIEKQLQEENNNGNSNA